jgi:hypothetical protein
MLTKPVILSTPIQPPLSDAQKRPTHVSKENYLTTPICDAKASLDALILKQVKRDLHMCQKTPTHVSKETYKPALTR